MVVSRVGIGSRLWLAALLWVYLTVPVVFAQEDSDALLDTTLFDIGGDPPSSELQPSPGSSPILETKKTKSSKIQTKSIAINPWMMTWRSVLADALKSSDKAKEQQDGQKATTKTRTDQTTSNTEPTITLAVAEKLIGERSASRQSFIPNAIRVDTTAFPQLVSPTKFDDLLQSPKIANFKVAGTEQSPTPSVGPLDQARERIKAEKKTPTRVKINRFKEAKGFTRVELTTLETLFDQTSTTSRPVSPPRPTPMDIARAEIRASLAPKLVSRQMVPISTPLTTDPTTTDTVPDPLDEAREEIRASLAPRLSTRQMIASTTMSEPTTPSTTLEPNPLDEARDEIRANLVSNPSTSRSSSVPLRLNPFVSGDPQPQPPGPTPMDLAREQIRNELNAPLVLLEASTGSNPFIIMEDEVVGTEGPMDAARNNIRDRLEQVPSTSLPTTLIPTTSMPTTPRTESPMATARNQIRDHLATSTVTPKISSTPPGVTQTEETSSPFNRMIKARDRLRLLMSQQTAEDLPSTTEHFAMAEARDKIRASLEADRLDPILKATDVPQPDFGESLLPPNQKQDPLISVTVRGHSGGLDPINLQLPQETIGPSIRVVSTVRPSITLEPLLDPASTTNTPFIIVDDESDFASSQMPFLATTEATLTTASPTRSEVIDFFESHTEAQSSAFEVLNTPTKMQGTLLRLIKKNQDPLDEVSELKQPILVGSEEEFNDFAAPKGKQNPLLRLLQPGNKGLVDTEATFEDFSPPQRVNGELQQSVKDPFSRPLPSHQQSLVDSSQDFQDFQAPDLKQDPLLRPLSGNSGRKSFSDFVPPSRKQNPLLRPLTSNQNLVNPRKSFSDFKPPSSKQDTLLKPLQDQSESSTSKPRRTFSDFKPPSRKQNPLLNRLRGGHRGRYQGLKLPHRKQDLLLRGLKAQQNEHIEGLEAPEEQLAGDAEVISAPQVAQGPKSQPLQLTSPKTITDSIESNRARFFKNRLQSKHNQKIEGLDVPDEKQNPLLGSLRGNQDDSNIYFEVPSQDPLNQPLIGDQSRPIAFSVPSQDPLNRPLSGDQTGSTVFSVPSRDPLNQPLSGDQSGPIRLSVPSQDPLNQPLSGDQSGAIRLSVPSQDPLNQPLSGDQSGPIKLSVHNVKQDPSLRQLNPDYGTIGNLDPPGRKQNPLLRPLQGGITGSGDELSVPNVKQDTLLKPLNPPESSGVADFDLPALKQNPLLRPLRPNVQDQPNLKPPKVQESQRLTFPSRPTNPLDKPLTPSIPFNPDILETPEVRNNPLMRIIKFDRRAKTNPSARQGSYMRLPIFRQVVLIPKRFAADFADLPKIAQDMLEAILGEKAPASFKFDQLASKVVQPAGDDFEPEVLSNIEVTTLAPRIISSTFSTLFPSAFPSSTTPKFRLLMPKNKFAILEVTRPVEEVRFQRVQETTTKGDAIGSAPQSSSSFSPPSAVSFSSIPATMEPFIPTMPTHTTSRPESFRLSDTTVSFFVDSTTPNVQFTPTDPPTTPPPFLLPTEADSSTTEEIVPDFTTFPQFSFETSTLSAFFPEISTPGVQPSRQFAMEVDKVTRVLSQTGFRMDRSRNLDMVEMLKEKATTSGSSIEEVSNHIDMVNKLIAVVQVAQTDESDQVEQVVDMIDKEHILERIVSTTPFISADDEAFLSTKIRTNLGPKADNSGVLTPPIDDVDDERLDFLIQKIRGHSGPHADSSTVLQPPQENNLSEEEISFLLKKIRGQSGSKKDFADILANEDHTFLATTTTRGPFLVRKVKTHKGSRRDRNKALSPPKDQKQFTIPSRFSPEVTTAQAVVELFLQEKIQEHEHSLDHGDFGDQLEPPKGKDVEFLVKKVKDDESSHVHGNFGDTLNPPSIQSEVEFLIKKIKDNGEESHQHGDFSEAVDLPNLPMSTSEKLTNSEEAAFLLHKIRNHLVPKQDSKAHLNVPRLHIPTTQAPPTEEELFLIKKIRKHQGQREDPNNGLHLPIRHLGQPTPLPPIKTSESTTDRLEFLIQKINSQSDIGEDFGQVLQFPINKLEVTTGAPNPTTTAKEEDDDSEIDFFLQKINLHDGIRQDFAEVLQTPPKNEKLQKDTFLTHKIKSNEGPHGDPGQDFLDVPDRDPFLVGKVRGHDGVNMDFTDDLTTPDVDPFLVQKIRNNPGSTLVSTEGLQVPREEFLLKKINKHPGSKSVSSLGLDAPREALLLAKIRAHQGEKSIDTEGLTAPEEAFLRQKINDHTGGRDVFKELLKVPDASESDAFLDQKINQHQGTTYDLTADLSMPNDYDEYESFLDQKVNQHEGVKDDFGGEFLQIPEHGTLPSVPRSSTPGPNAHQESKRFEEKIRNSRTKEEIEDHIMDMIVKKPEMVVNILVNMFNIESESERLDQKAKLSQLVELDPLSVTVAFSDLMAKQNEAITPQVPHKYEDPPEEVRGQLLRVTMPEMMKIETPVLAGKVLDGMLTLMASGDLRENIVDQMIDAGILDEMDLKYPSSTGQAPKVTLDKEREQLSPQRQKEMSQANQNPPMIFRDQKHQMIDVDITDPSYDFETVEVEEIPGEMMNNSELAQDDKEEEQGINGVEKDIDVVKSMMTLFEHGLIDQKELQEMMDFLGQDMEAKKLPNESNSNQTATTHTSLPKKPSVHKQQPPSTNSGSSYSYINFPRLPRPEQIPNLEPHPIPIQRRPPIKPQSMFQEPLVETHPFAQPHRPKVRPPPPPPPRPTQPFVRINGQPEITKAVSYAHIDMGKPVVHRPRVPLVHQAPQEHHAQPTFRPRIPIQTRPPHYERLPTRKPVLLEPIIREPLIPASHKRPQSTFRHEYFRPSGLRPFEGNPTRPFEGEAPRPFDGEAPRPFEGEAPRPFEGKTPRPFEDKAPLVQGFSDTFTNGELNKQSFEDLFSNIDLSMHHFETGYDESQDDSGHYDYATDNTEPPHPHQDRPSPHIEDEDEFRSYPIQGRPLNDEEVEPVHEFEFGSDAFKDQKSFVAHLIDTPQSGLSHEQSELPQGLQEPRAIDGFEFSNVNKLKQELKHPFGPPTHEASGEDELPFDDERNPHLETSPKSGFKLSSFPQPPFAPPPGLILSKRVQPWMEEYPARPSLHYPPVPAKRSRYLPTDAKYQSFLSQEMPQSSLESYYHPSGHSHYSPVEDLSRRSFDVAAEATEEVDYAPEALFDILTGNPQVDRNIEDIWLQFNQNSS